MNNGPGPVWTMTPEAGFNPGLRLRFDARIRSKKESPAGLGAQEAVQPGLAVPPTEQLLWGDSATSCWFQGRLTISAVSTRMT
jgi:hypothetical protein